MRAFRSLWCNTAPAQTPDEESICLFVLTSRHGAHHFRAPWAEAQRWVPVELGADGRSGALPLLGGWCTLGFDSDGGLIVRSDRLQWTRPLGALVYQTLNDDSFDDYRAQYLVGWAKTSDSKVTYGKPGLTAAIARERLWSPRLSEAHVSNASTGSAVVARLQFAAAAHQQFGAPSEAWVRLEIGTAESRRLNLTVQLVNKTSTRID